MRDVPPAAPQARRWAIRLFVGVAFAVAACGGAPGATVPASPALVATAAPTRSGPQTGASRSPDQAFADGWLGVVVAHDAAATAVLIANPLAEWDLVGVRLVDVVRATRGQLSTLSPPARLQQDMSALDAALAANLALLGAVDPHGTRADQEAAYGHALDDWIDHVRPDAQSIRDALGLAPVPPGDLQL